MIELDEGRRESRDSMNGDLIHSLKPHTSNVMLGSKWRGSWYTLNCDWGDWLRIVNPIYFRGGDVYLWQWDQAQIRGEKYFNLWRRMEEENWWWDRLKAGEVWFEIGNDDSNDPHNWPSGLVWDQGREVSGEPWFVIWDDIDNYQPSWLQEKRGSVWEVIKIMPKYGRIFRLRLFLCKIALWRRVLQSSIQLGCSGKASKGLKN